MQGTVSRQFGAVLFSSGLQSVLLVQREEGSSWSFPYGSSEESVHLGAAVSVIKSQLGIDVTDQLHWHNWVEVGTPPTFCTQTPLHLS